MALTDASAADADADADGSAPSDDAESWSGSAFGGASAEKIEKIVHAPGGADGARARRSLRQLSGGERRRAALALALAHADLAASRGGVHCDLLVLDEVLQHLDAEGIARVAAALRAMPRGTVLLTSQADSATSHLFDTVDRVWKRGECWRGAREERRPRRGRKTSAEGAARTGRGVMMGKRSEARALRKSTFRYIATGASVFNHPRSPFCDRLYTDNTTLA